MFPAEYKVQVLRAISEAPVEHKAPAPVGLREWFWGLPAPERLRRLVRAARDAVARGDSDPCGCAKVLGATVGVITGSVSATALREARSAMIAARQQQIFSASEAWETACAVHWLAFLVLELDCCDCAYGTADPW